MTIRLLLILCSIAICTLAHATQKLTLNDRMVIEFESSKYDVEAILSATQKFALDRSMIESSTSESATKAFNIRVVYVNYTSSTLKAHVEHGERWKVVTVWYAQNMPEIRIRVFDSEESCGICTELLNWYKERSLEPSEIRYIEGYEDFREYVDVLRKKDQDH